MLQVQFKLQIAKLNLMSYSVNWIYSLIR